MPHANATPNQDQRTPTVRFAPSPNGLLHPGHARSAVLNWRFAADHDGVFLLRIEDIDIARARPEYEAAIFKDLDWLGLAWPTPVRRQSDHFADYEAALAEMRRLGLLYPAFMSRSEAQARVREIESTGQPWPRDPDGAAHYPGDDRALSDSERKSKIADGTPHAWRLDMRAALNGLGAALLWDEHGAGPEGETGKIASDPAAWGDVALARKDFPASYHLAVTVDDAIQDITDVIRGQDLFAATSVHRLLQQLLGLPVPQYRHHSLVLDSTGRKLSKSDGAVSIASLRDQGVTPFEVMTMAGMTQES